MNVDSMVTFLNGAIERVNDLSFERSRKVNRKKVKWWTRELNVKRRMTRRLRRRFQRARSSNAINTDQLRRAYIICLNEYKTMILNVKENEWRSFVSDHRDDPWGHVYKIARNRKKTV